jgi:hypothetical protein
MRQVVIWQFAMLQHRVDMRQTSLWTITHGNCHGAVEMHIRNASKPQRHRTRTAPTYPTSPRRGGSTTPRWEQYHWMNSSMACRYPRFDSCKRRLSSTADRRWSRSGRRSFVFGRFDVAISAWRVCSFQPPPTRLAESLRSSGASRFLRQIFCKVKRTKHLKMTVEVEMM